MRNDRSSGSDLAEVTSTLVAYNPFNDLVEAAAKHGCRVTITVDINPPDQAGSWSESTERTYERGPSQG